MIALHTAIAIVAIIFLIIKVKVDPIIALVLGALYLGLASGMGFVATIEAVTSGFGDIMAKIGLLIGFGVLMGALLHRMGAFKVMVEALVRVVPANKLPYALALALTTIAPSIYVDVQVVLAAPVARSSSTPQSRSTPAGRSASSAPTAAANPACSPCLPTNFMPKQAMSRSRPAGRSPASRRKPRRCLMPPSIS